MLGIEINPFAAELARVSVWIGEIQWMREHGLEASRNPILKPLDTIRCHDALLNEDGTQYEWPAADVIIGNPPFLGAAKFLREFGAEYSACLRTAYQDFVPGGADLVTYWFVKSSAANQTARRVGLVATNSVRHSASNVPIRFFSNIFGLYEAWSDQPWIQDGASVRISILCGSKDAVFTKNLDGELVGEISPRLSTSARVPQPLRGLNGYIFRGPPKIGSFDIDGSVARAWLQEPLNPNGEYNAKVLRPIWVANDIVKRPRDKWIVDFANMPRDQACLFQKPFEYVEANVKPTRAENNRPWRRDNWWLHGETIPALRAAMATFDKVIVTGMVTKHRVFVWMPTRVFPDQRLMVICRDDDVALGVLSSRIHEAWTYENCSWHGVGNDPVYNAGSVFETFPFPEDMSPNVPAPEYAADPRAITIAAAARKLHELRENWINPPDLVVSVPEVVPGYPHRIRPNDDAAAAILQKRTMTNFYNERPTWLDLAHTELDRAVAAAYGWNDWGADGLPDVVILERLFKLNQERAAAARRS